MNLSESNSISFLNVTNVTSAENGFNVIQTVLDTLIYSILVVVMFSMGCSVSLLELKRHMAKPYGIIIGMLCQFLLMPASSLGVIKVFGISGLHATGILLTSCCPGGTVSNVFTYFTEGDISLSVAMTTLSGIMALLAMPGNLWLYGLIVDTGEAKVPYLMILLSVSITIVPALAGYLFKYKFPKAAPKATKYGSISGMTLVIATIGLSIYDKPEIYVKAPIAVYGASVILPPFALIVAYLVSWIFRRPPRVRRTIAIEASMQNVGIALAVASLSFPRKIVRPVMLYPALYAITMIFSGTILSIIYKISKKCTSKEEKTVENTYIS